jgi:hypothetical protein
VSQPQPERDTLVVGIQRDPAGAASVTRAGDGNTARVHYRSDRYLAVGHADGYIATNSRYRAVHAVHALHVVHASH